MGWDSCELIIFVCVGFSLFSFLLLLLLLLLLLFSLLLLLLVRFSSSLKNKNTFFRVVIGFNTFVFLHKKTEYFWSVTSARSH